MDLKKNLIELGLNRNEATVYLALLSTGLTQAGPLIKQTKLHRMLVYNALETLQNLGLVEIVHKKNVKLFSSSDPAALVDRVKRLHDLAKVTVPDLLQLQAKKQDAINVRTLVGQEGFATNLQEVIESAARSKNHTMYIIGGAKDTDFYEAVGAWYDSYVELLQKNKIKKLLLAPSHYSTVFKKKFMAEYGNTLKTLPQGLTSPTYTRITDEMVSFEIYHPQILIIQIKNPAIALGYKDSFNLLWKNTKS